jgi:hypothetical protein
MRILLLIVPVVCFLACQKQQSGTPSVDHVDTLVGIYSGSTSVHITRRVADSTQVTDTSYLDTVAITKISANIIKYSFARAGLSGAGQIEIKSNYSGEQTSTAPYNITTFKMMFDVSNRTLNTDFFNSVHGEVTTDITFGGVRL